MSSAAVEEVTEEPRLQHQAFYMGLDLGQSRDFTAIIVVEQLALGSDAEDKEYHIRYCERMQLGTSYTEVTKHVKSLLARINEPTTLIVDSTGVGRPVIDALRESGLTPVPITVHGGQNVTIDESGWHVPKRDLVAAAKVLLAKSQLKIGKTIGFADVLISELQNFHVNININTGRDSYEAWREGDHDDLVFAVSLACWWALKHPKKIEEPTYVPREMWRPNPHKI